jgi:hypothetical protein
MRVISRAEMVKRGNVLWNSSSPGNAILGSDSTKSLSAISFGSVLK